MRVCRERGCLTSMGGLEDTIWAGGWAYLKYKFLKILLDDHVLDRVHGDLEKIGIRRVGEMSIDISCRISIQRYEFVHEVFAGCLPVSGIA